MPLYDYRCERGHVTEIRHGFDEQSELACEVDECGADMEKVFINAPPVKWNCAGATVGYRGGKGTNIPDTSRLVPNPGHEPPTTGKLGLSYERQKELGL